MCGTPAHRRKVLSISGPAMVSVLQQRMNSAPNEFVRKQIQMQMDQLNARVQEVGVNKFVSRKAG